MFQHTYRIRCLRFWGPRKGLAIYLLLCTTQLPNFPTLVPREDKTAIFDDKSSPESLEIFFFYIFSGTIINPHLKSSCVILHIQCRGPFECATIRRSPSEQLSLDERSVRTGRRHTGIGFPHIYTSPCSCASWTILYFPAIFNKFYFRS